MELTRQKNYSQTFDLASVTIKGMVLEERARKAAQKVEEELKTWLKLQKEKVPSQVRRKEINRRSGSVFSPRPGEGDSLRWPVA